MKSKKWLIIYASITVIFLSVIGSMVIYYDPYMHFHKPLVDKYSYAMNDKLQRNVNDGIIKHFDYDAIVTGTSMSENFKASQFDNLFGTNCIKVPFSGGTYKEIHDRLETALEKNQNIKVILWSIDGNYVFFDKNYVLDDRYEYPDYLYDDNPLNDVNYIFNHDVVFDKMLSTVYSMKRNNLQPGIINFDDYSNWNNQYVFGKNAVFPFGYTFEGYGEPQHMTEEEKETLLESIQQNLTSLPLQYPDVRFIYYIPPYSAAWWAEKVSSGEICKQLEAEKILIFELLNVGNIVLYGFDNDFEMTTDLNNYKDKIHYGQWISSDILISMSNGENRLTLNNYISYLDNINNYYSSFDFNSLNNQVDLEDDHAMVAEAAIEYEPVDDPITFDEIEDKIELNNAQISEEKYNDQSVITCKGRLERISTSDVQPETFIYNDSYIGLKFKIDDISKYNTLLFYGRKTHGNGQPTVCVYDEKGAVQALLARSYSEIDENWNQYYLDVHDVTGAVTIILNGGYIDSTGDPESEFQFSGIKLQ